MLGKAFFKETVEEWEETKKIIDLFMEGYD